MPTARPASTAQLPRPSRAHRARYRRILRFASRQLAELWWFELALPRLGLRAIADRTRERRLRRIARRFHALAIELGGLMIKVGQFLSSRLDVLPPEITAELEGLQDEVPAVAFADIRAHAEAELGTSLATAFAWFDEVPLAAASLGQAHRARLSPLDAADAGFADVVVKVQRPGIDEIVAVDLSALRRVGGWLRRVRFVSSRVDAPAIVEEFAQTSEEEIDYLHEALNAERFAADFADDRRAGAPEVAWGRSTRRVLTLSDVTAIKINDRAALIAAGIDPAAVADAFAAVMFDQIFTHRFFHADPHPGNAFVTPLSAADGPAWQLTFIDFGMMGEIPAELRSGLRSLVIAVSARDGRRLIGAAQQLGMLLPSADTVHFERALTELFARFGGMGFAELSAVDPREFRQFAREFGDTIRSLPFQLPEGLLLLLRTVSLTSGLCSALNPAFNVWNAVEPYAARLLRDEGPPAVRELAGSAWETATLTAGLPRRIDSVIERIEAGTVSFDTSRLERRLARLERIGVRILSAVVFAGLAIAGALALQPDPTLGVVLLSASAVPLAHALVSGLVRRDRA